MFYNSYIKLNDAQMKSLLMATISQSESELWNDGRKIKITGRSDHKVPVRHTTKVIFSLENICILPSQETHLLDMDKKVN